MDWPGSALTPGHLEFFLILCTVGEVKVDECLIGNAGAVGFLTEIVDRIAVNINCDLLFQLLCIGIPFGSGKIIFFSHNDHLNRGRIWLHFLLLVWLKSTE